MKGMTRARAVEAFANLGLSVANEKLARYWLSLWRGDELPLRADFAPSQVRDHLPGIGIFEVRPGESTRCRLAGTAMHRAIGYKLTGRDWKSYTPQELWGERLQRNTLIAEGAVGIGIRRSELAEGLRVTQELQLPFADETEDGARLLLFHLDWRPGHNAHKPRGGAIQIADEFHTVPLSA